ncbi:MAG: hypothetical protein AAF800_02685 [Planctomycetota bacterium]
MDPTTLRPRAAAVCLSLLCLVLPAHADPPKTTLEPPAASPTLTRVLDSPALDDAERRRLELFHGRWDNLEPLTPDEAAALAWAQRRVDDPVFDDDTVDPILRAKAARFRGDAKRVLALLAEDTTVQGTLLRARALEDLGRLADAVELLTPLRDRFQHETIDDPAELTAAAEAIVALAALEGRPAQDYRLALRMLGRAYQQLDPLYWPARVAEGRLLMTKDNRPEAAEVFEEALTLNPHAAGAWAGLGQLAVESFSFDAAAEVAARLRVVNPGHALAAEIEAYSLLQQRDVAAARAAVEPALFDLPRRRELLALHAAVAACAYDDEALTAALDRFDAVAPGSPLAHYTAGRALSNARQYEPARRLLQEAVDRAPNWPAPRLELALLLMRYGDVADACAQLAHAARLDPFHVRVNNQLRLAEDLVNVYQTIETEHFVIRYRPGPDEALAREMPEHLEAMYDEITATFGHRPANKTLVELMPDQRTFGVRLSGLPNLPALGAAVGDVIGLTPPRSGPGQADPFNWVNVMRHEFAHTVNLTQTDGRVPHWFTEACAVSVETTDRTYATYQLLLAAALNEDFLFDYDEINWGFIRPRTPRDTPLAYAQSGWMLEFIRSRWGNDAAVRMLDLYRDGASDPEALRQVTGYDPDAFMDSFRGWAAGQVEAWGLAPVEASEEVEAVLASAGEDVDTAELIALYESDGSRHPGLLRLIAGRAVDLPDAEAARHWLHRYAEARPADPWPHRQLVKLAFDLGEPDAALGSLQLLEKTNNYTADWSRQLAQLHRDAGRLDRAYHATRRALHFEPYNASFRELAATLALQRGDLDAAAFQVEALEMLEPDRPIHARRLAALYDRLGRPDDAAAARERSR